MSNNPISIFLPRAVRIIVYALFLLGVAQILMLDAQEVTDGDKFRESSWTETLQQTFVLITSMLFVIIALTNKYHKGLAFSGAALFIMAFFREFNNYLGEGIFTGGWQTYTIISGGALFFIAFKHRIGFFKSFDKMFNHSSFGILVSGFLITFFFSRLYGRTVFWKALMEDQYFRSVKNASEEGIELLGYSLILIGTIELFLFFRRDTTASDKV